MSDMTIPLANQYLRRAILQFGLAIAAFVIAAIANGADDGMIAIVGLGLLLFAVYSLLRGLYLRLG